MEPVNTSKQKSLITSILLTGLLAGTLDILSAIVHYFIRTGKNPAGILKYVASGLFGKDAFAGDSLMIVWGLLLHYCIAIIFTAFYFLVYPKINLLAKNIVLSGVAYGLFVWLVMNFIVLPLSRVQTGAFNLLHTLIGMAILAFAIGLPVAILTYRYYINRQTKSR